MARFVAPALLCNQRENAGRSSLPPGSNVVTLKPMSASHPHDVRLAPLRHSPQASAVHAPSGTANVPAFPQNQSFHHSQHAFDYAGHNRACGSTQFAPLPSISSSLPSLSASDVQTSQHCTTVVDAKGPSGFVGTYVEDYGCVGRSNMPSDILSAPNTTPVVCRPDQSCRPLASQAPSQGYSASWARTASAEGASFETGVTMDVRCLETANTPVSPSGTPGKSSIVPPPGQKVSSMSIETLLTSDDDFNNQSAAPEMQTSLPPPPAYNELYRSTQVPHARQQETWAPPSCSPTSSMDVQHAGYASASVGRNYYSACDYNCYPSQPEHGLVRHNTNVASNTQQNTSQSLGTQHFASQTNAQTTACSRHSMSVNIRNDPVVGSVGDQPGYVRHIPQEYQLARGSVVNLDSNRQSCSSMAIEAPETANFYADESVPHCRPFTRVVSETEASSVPGGQDPSQRNGHHDARVHQDFDRTQPSYGTRAYSRNVSYESMQCETAHRPSQSIASPAQASIPQEASSMTSPSSIVSAPELDGPRSRRKRSRARGEPRELFKCPYANCNKVSAEASNIKAHCRTHTGEKPYVCQTEACGKRFRWKSSLSYHQKAVHSNLRPYACNFCDKRFLESRKLQLHLDWCPAMRQQQEHMANESRNQGSASFVPAQEYATRASAGPSNTVSQPRGGRNDSEIRSSDSAPQMAAATTLASISAPSAGPVSAFFAKRR